MFFVVVAASRPLPARILGARPLVAIGIASYRVYLVRTPFISALRHVGVSHALAACIGLAIGFAFWATIERPVLCVRFRHPLERHIRDTLRLPSVA